jgi:hypothetical protein
MRWPIKNGKNLSHEFQNLAFYFNVSSFYGYICCSYFKIFRYILTSKPELKCMKRLYVYALLDLTCDLMVYKKSSQVKSFCFEKYFKSSQVKSSDLWLDLTWFKSKINLTCPSLVLNTHCLKNCIKVSVDGECLIILLKISK